jgi:hypothetical protein
LLKYKSGDVLAGLSIGKSAQPTSQSLTPWIGKRDSDYIANTVPVVKLV